MDGNKHILIIDDDPLFVRMYERVLLQAGYDVAVARNGKEGLATLQEQKPNAVILDLLMPELNGYEVLRQAKEDPELAQIPIIIFTSLLKEEDRTACLRAGAAAFFVKESSSRPLLLEKLKEVIR